MTDIFKFDANYIENEERYKSIRAEILGEGSSDEESGSEEESSDEDENEEEGKHPCNSLQDSTLIALF